VSSPVAHCKCCFSVYILGFGYAMRHGVLWGIPFSDYTTPGSLVLFYIPSQFGASSFFVLLILGTSSQNLLVCNSRVKGVIVVREKASGQEFS
jgi:hypothetical protein